MAMAMVSEELARPLNVLDSLFGRHMEQVANAGGKLPEAEFGERNHFQKILGLDNEEGLARIPCLNDVPAAESVPPFTLVRYRCLVQDTFEPEFYTAVLQEVDSQSGATRLRTSKYRECIDATPGAVLRELDGHEGLSQRGVCYCVPLPGETAWARAAAAEWTAAGGGASFLLPTASSATKPKRRRDDDVDMAPEAETAHKPRTDVLPAAGGYAGGSPANAVANVITGNVRCAPCGQGSMVSAEDFGLNFPIPGEERRGTGSSTACIVKLYDSDAEALRLCEAVELIGILCVNPEIADLPDAATGRMEDALRDARQPSTSLVPRLHVLAHRKLPFHHPLLPYTPDFLSEARLASAFQKQLSAPNIMMAARSAAIMQLAKEMGGDMVAAEYLLMLLVSRSFQKHGDKLLGSWSLNVAGWPSALKSHSLGDAVGELVPRVAHLEVSNNTLNTHKWKPRKDFVANRLVAGQLQLAAGTLVMIDECKMSEGELNAEGVKNFLAIQEVVVDNKLPCDFTSYDVKVPLEVSCVLLSERKSIVKGVDVLTPLRPTQTALPDSPSDGSALSAARWLIALVTRLPRPVRIPDDVMQQFGENFAEARQEFQTSADLAHTWMALARARCLTFGEEELSIQRWRELMELERTRLVRCREDSYSLQ